MRQLRLPTITDISKRANISYEDVFRYFYKDKLDAKAAMQVRQLLKESGRADDMADSIRPRDPNAIGIVLPEFIVDDYMAKLLKGVEAALKENDYGSTYHGVDMHADVAEATTYYQALFASGLAESCFIITYTSPSTQAIIPMCEQYHRPYIIMDRDFNEDTGDSPAVTLDNKVAIQEAMRYLIKLGHRRIGFITGMLPAPSAYFRLEGYKAGLEEAGIPFDPALVVNGSWQVHTSKAGTEELLKLENRPTAIVASNDVMALSAISTIVLSGLKVPDDISVMGFDDIPMAANTHPSLTTIRQQIEEMGHMAGEMAVALASGKALKEKKTRSLTELVIRKSTAAPRRRPAASK